MKIANPELWMEFLFRNGIPRAEVFTIRGGLYQLLRSWGYSGALEDMLYLYLIDREGGDGSLADRLYRSFILDRLYILTNSRNVAVATYAGATSSNQDTVINYAGQVEGVPANTPVMSGMRLATTVADGAKLGEELVGTPNTVTILATGSWIMVTVPLIGDVLETGGVYLLDIENVWRSGTGVTGYVKGTGQTIAQGRNTYLIVASSGLTMNGIPFGSSQYDADITVHSVKQVIPKYVHDDENGFHNHPTIAGGTAKFLAERIDSTLYTVGDEVYSARYALRCTVQGTSAATAPTITAVDLGSTITDGGVTWAVDSRYQPDVGYRSTPSRTNIYWPSTGVANGVGNFAVFTGGGTGTTPVVTSNYATGPDGVALSASRFQADKGAATTAGDYSTALWSASGLASTADHANGLWVKSNTGVPQNLLIYDAANAAGTVVPVGLEWSRIQCPSGAGVSTDQNMVIGTRGTSGSYFQGGDQTLDILIAYPHGENNTTILGPDITTTTGALTTPGTKLELPTEGFLRSNDLAIMGTITPYADTTTTKMPLSTSGAANRYLLVRDSTIGHGVAKKYGATEIGAYTPYMGLAGETYQYQAYYSSTIGIGIRTRYFRNGVWSAWSTWATNPDTGDSADMIGTTMEVGSYIGIYQIEGAMPDIRTEFTSDPKAWLEAQE